MEKSLQRKCLDYFEKNNIKRYVIFNRSGFSVEWGTNHFIDDQGQNNKFRAAFKDKETLELLKVLEIKNKDCIFF